MANWHLFETRDEMVAALKADVERRLQAGILARGRASWAVSGGNTPAPLFEAMQNAGLDWSKVDVMLVDERWVGYDHPRSNEAFIERHLKAGGAAEAVIFGMKTEHATPQEGAADANARYGTEPLPFDSVLLGLGPDGHTASLFPDADGLEAAMAPDCPDTCVALTALKSDVTGDEVDRMSLSARAIADARHVVMMITGDEKKRVCEAALEPGSTLPAGRLHEMVQFDVYWAP